jgi:hypothetical protein
MLAENNVHIGFFEPDQFEAVRRLMPPVLRSLVTFAYVTGWRMPSEILTLSSGGRSIFEPVWSGLSREQRRTGRAVSSPSLRSSGPSSRHNGPLPVTCSAVRAE